MLKGYPLGIWGYLPGVRGYSLGVRGYPLGVRGYPLGVRGYLLGVRGYPLGVRGYSPGVSSLLRQMAQKIMACSIYSRANTELKYSLLGARRLIPIHAKKYSS